MDDPKTRGRLKIFLGYAAGVGKTFRMLEEAQRLRGQGRDVVVGYFEPYGRAETTAKLEGLEVVPRRIVDYRGRPFEEMDTEAILRRRPEVCAIDELAHSNVPRSGRKKRWEDIVAIGEAGIDVLTTMNIQHLESLNDRVREISGVEVRETVPDWILKEADEVVLIDLTPQALLNRLARGVVYPEGTEKQARATFFKEPTLVALREMTLRQTAHEVDVRQVGPLSRAAVDVPAGESRERILIHVTESPATGALIRRGRRVADHVSGDCFAVAVVPRNNVQYSSGPAADAILEHLAFARRLHIETRRIEAGDVAAALVDFARRNGVTQIFLAKPAPRFLSFLRPPETAMRVVELAQDMQIIVVAERRASGGDGP